MLRVFLLSLLMLFVLTVQAQVFVPKSLPGLFSSGVPHWADFDNDGDMDVFVSRSIWEHPYCFLNNGQEFTQIGFFLPYFTYTPVWQDFNHDGYLDLMYPHFVSRLPEVNLVLPFDGCNFRDWVDTLSICGETDFKNIKNFVAHPGDEDGDGDLDYLFNVATESSRCGLKLYRFNQRSFQEEATTIFQSDLEIDNLLWQDFDADGDLDILLIENYRPKLLRNQQGHYTLLNAPFGQFDTNDVSWFDIDLDGDMDVVQSGNAQDGSHRAGLEVYTYANGQYSLLYSDYVDYTDLHIDPAYGHCEMGDIDNDGDIDIVAAVNGYPNFSSYSFRVYHNQGVDGFLPDSTIDADFNVNYFKLIDFDQDGDVDITTGNKIYQNTLTKKCLPPSIPQGVTSSVSGKDVTLSWQASSDALYPSTSLTYNVHINTSVEGLSYLDGMSNLVTGQRRTLQAGNAGSFTSQTLRNVPDGTYYWVVQAISPNLAASSYSSLQSFTVVNGSVLTGSITLGALQWLNTCECNKMVMEVKPAGTFGADNRFLLQLSDSSGSFATPTTLFDHYFGDQAGQHNGIQEGKIAGWLPKTMPQGTHYRVRVISTHPARVSFDNGYDIAVKKAPQLPGAITAPSQELCLNSPDTRLKLSVPALYTNYYSWDIWPSQAGVVKADGLEAIVNWADDYFGPVQIRVKGINGCGEGPYSVPLKLFVRPLPSPANSIRLPKTICPGQTRVLVEIDSTAYADAYEWTLPPGASVSMGTANNQRAILLDFTTDFTNGIISVVPRSVCGVGQGSQALMEVPGKIAKAAPIEGPDTLCIGQRWITYTVPEVANATHYEWILPDGFASSSESNITETNQLTVHADHSSAEGSLSVLGFNACYRGEAAAPLNIWILKPPTQAGPIQGPREVCTGGTMATYQVESIKEATGYEWTLPPGMQPSKGTNRTTSSQITVRIGNDFTGGELYLEALNPCGYGAASEVIIINALPYLKTPIITQTCNILQTEETIYPLQWLWNNQLLANATTAEISITQQGTYKVRVSGPCDTLETSLTTQPILGNRDEIPNAFSPNGDEKNEYFQLADQLLGSKLTIYNRWGEMIYQSDNYQNDWQGKEQAGIYYYALSNHCFPEPVRGMIHLVR